MANGWPNLRDAINAVSDVVQNRPAPLREFDQIYMKTADMVEMAMFVARRFKDKRLVFVGDGDAIALSVMHLAAKALIPDSPASVLVLEFDERIVNSIMRFADTYEMQDRVSALLYNVVDPLPSELVQSRDAFYTNPPWGASNDGTSIIAFMERGMEACVPGAQGLVVLADEPELPWTKSVLLAVQRAALGHGYMVKEMVPEWHFYHLDDAPDLRSCALLLSDVEQKNRNSLKLPVDRRENFYGLGNPLRYRYVRENETLNYGRAPETTYDLIPMGEGESG